MTAGRAAGTADAFPGFTHHDDDDIVHLAFWRWLLGDSYDWAECHAARQALPDDVAIWAADHDRPLTDDQLDQLWGMPSGLSAQQRARLVETLRGWRRDRGAAFLAEWRGRPDPQAVDTAQSI